MASKQELVDYITEQMAGGGNLRNRKMFGEYAIYCNEKVIALVCDDTLFLKPTEAGLTLLRQAKHGPAYPGGKPQIIVSEELFDDHEFMASLARETAKALPMPKPKKNKKK
jgi:TfoX/Sxy family transcriptional regulator of competence genes